MRHFEVQVHGATVLVDALMGTLRPKTRKDDFVFGVCTWAFDVEGLRKQRAARKAAIEAANKVLGKEPVLGWRWLGLDGYLRYIS